MNFITTGKLTLTKRLSSIYGVNSVEKLASAAVFAASKTATTMKREMIVVQVWSCDGGRVGVIVEL